MFYESEVINVNEESVLQESVRISAVTNQSALRQYEGERSYWGVS